MAVGVGTGLASALGGYVGGAVWIVGGGRTTSDADGELDESQRCSRGLERHDRGDGVWSRCVVSAGVLVATFDVPSYGTQCVVCQIVMANFWTAATQ